MKRVRIGNDIRNLEISVTRLSVPFTSWDELINLEIYAFIRGKRGYYITPSQILKEADKLRLYFDSKDLGIGEYDILIKFSIADDTFSESLIDKAIDIQRVFEIVEYTAQEEDTENEFSVDLNYGRDGQSTGVTTYTWIKYSDVADGTDLYDTPTANTLYIGIAVNKTTATESTVKTDYVWSKFKGEPGPSIELQKTSTHIQWRVYGTLDWTNLVSIADLMGNTITSESINTIKVLTQEEFDLIGQKDNKTLYIVKQ